MVAALDDDRRHRRRRRWVIIVALLAVVGVVAGLALRTARRPPPSYASRVALRGPLVLAVAATGAVEPKNAVDVGADISGRVARVFVDLNDRVFAGQVLAELQTEVLDLAVRQARAAAWAAVAARVQAEIARDDAERGLRRATQLADTATISAAELDEARSARRRAGAALGVVDANIATARAALALAEANRGKAVIRAPIDGIVLARNVEPGQVVISALQAAVLFRLAADFAHLQVRADIDEADVARVQPGQAATFTVSASPEATYRARVRTLSNAPRVFQQVVTYEALLDVDNPDGALRPGMTTTLRIATGRVDDAVLVPVTALRFVPKTARTSTMTGPPRTTQEAEHAAVPRVWVLVGGVPVARDVVVRASDGETAAVSGVEDGEAVLVGEGSAT